MSSVLGNVLRITGSQSDCVLVEQLEKNAILTAREQRVAQLAAAAFQTRRLPSNWGLIEGTVPIVYFIIAARLMIRSTARFADKLRCQFFSADFFENRQISLG